MKKIIERCRRALDLEQNEDMEVQVKIDDMFFTATFSEGETIRLSKKSLKNDWDDLMKELTSASEKSKPGYGDVENVSKNSPTKTLANPETNEISEDEEERLLSEFDETGVSPSMQQSGPRKTDDKFKDIQGSKLAIEEIQSKLIAQKVENEKDDDFVDIDRRIDKKDDSHNYNAFSNETDDSQTKQNLETSNHAKNNDGNKNSIDDKNINDGNIDENNGNDDRVINDSNNDSNDSSSNQNTNASNSDGNRDEVNKDNEKDQNSNKVVKRPLATNEQAQTTFEFRINEKLEYLNRMVNASVQLHKHMQEKMQSWLQRHETEDKAEANQLQASTKNHPSTKPTSMASVQLVNLNQANWVNERCFECDDIGHLKNDCPLKGRGLKKCYECQQFTTHKGYECPQRLAKQTNFGRGGSKVFRNTKDSQ